MARLVTALVATELPITGKGAYKDEFVTAGGVDWRGVDRHMASRHAPGLYFAGEVLDVDGVTGGFNFQAAWTTGWLAGRAAARAVVAAAAAEVGAAGAGGAGGQRQRRGWMHDGRCSRGRELLLRDGCRLAWRALRPARGATQNQRPHGGRAAGRRRRRRAARGRGVATPAAADHGVGDHGRSSRHADAASATQSRRCPLRRFESKKKN
eukprot:TRINITY_DN3720_c0_g1_i1.p2 TRINITY_DN3720_c0_g1~~TRINITY_DN3720_c0_g1_i1.p2  ORF type:complete len:209 (-),score=42.06 TRINITY_DN3720_c0_g1_i1:28-654(-)